MSKQDSPKWYEKAQEYWKQVDSNIEGMLGGYGTLTDIDAQGSKRFIADFVDKGLLKTNRACDCGAGIGRVTQTFLIHYYQHVDLVELTEKFLEQAKVEFEILGYHERITCIPSGLQDFHPEKGKYDLIWCQWVLSQLTDRDLVEFLIRCKESLHGGYIGIKENVAPAGILYDDQDSSCTRSDYLWKMVFEAAGLTIFKEQVQIGFPKTIYEVKMYLLQ
jgi:protein N-terminal methyltransferase